MNRRVLMHAIAAFALGLTMQLPALAADDGAPPPGDAYVVGAIHWSDGKAQFFFSDGTYTRYDVKADHGDKGYPKPVDKGTWPGLTR